jgi:hypothetical protein
VLSDISANTCVWVAISAFRKWRQKARKRTRANAD